MRCKKTIDARSYSHEALEQLRRDAVKRVQAGEGPEAVAAGLGINRRTIYRWLSAYHYGGPGPSPQADLTRSFYTALPQVYTRRP